MSKERMAAIHELPHQLDREKRECWVVIETPKGRRNKFKYLPESGLFSLSHVLPQGFNFPFDFGFVPSTLAEDGDPLDMIVLMDEPAHVGCLLRIRIIGVMRVQQTEKGKTVANDRLLGVTLQTFEYADVYSFEQLPKNFVNQIAEFLALYNKNAGKQDEVTGIEGAESALRLLEEAAERAGKSDSR
jgi:inorganic pyrophosphatase